jgi:ABC-type branched-subunit amino acid transport system substrate-binding protein
MRIKSMTGLLLLLLPVMVVSSACASFSAKPPVEGKVLRVGALVPLSGAASKWGLEARKIYPAIMNAYNGKEGGIRVGDDIYKLEIVDSDAPGFPPSADLAGAKDLVFNKKVNAICVYYGIAGAPIATITNKARVIFNQGTMFSSYYDPKQYKYCIFGYPIFEILQWQPLYMVKALPDVKCLAFLNARTGDPGLEQSDSQEVRIQTKEQRGYDTLVFLYPAGTQNFTPYLTKIKESGADAIYTMCSIPEIGMMAKQSHELGYKFYIGWSASIVDINELRNLCGGDEAMENICPDWSAPYNLKESKISPKYAALTDSIRSELKKTYGNEPGTGTFSVTSQMIGQYIEAVQRAGSIDPDAVMKQLNGGTLDTFLGTFKLTGSKNYGADVVCGYHQGIGIIKRGQIQYLTEWNMEDADILPLGGPRR